MYAIFAASQRSSSPSDAPQHFETLHALLLKTTESRFSPGEVDARQLATALGQHELKPSQTSDDRKGTNRQSSETALPLGPTMPSLIVTWKMILRISVWPVAVGAG